MNIGNAFLSISLPHFFLTVGLEGLRVSPSGHRAETNMNMKVGKAGRLAGANTGRRYPGEGKLASLSIRAVVV